MKRGALGEGYRASASTLTRASGNGSMEQSAPAAIESSGNDRCIDIDHFKRAFSTETVVYNYAPSRFLEGQR